MTPLGKVVVGLLLVFVDLRIDGFDVVPDVIGWALALIGLHPLSRRHGGFLAAAVAAGIGIVLALPQQLVEPGSVLRTLEAVAETVLVFGTCTGIIALVAEPSVRRTANRIRWTDLGLGLLATLLGLALGQDSSLSGGAVVPVLVLALATIAVVIWFLVFLWRNRHRPELLPGDRTVAIP